MLQALRQKAQTVKVLLSLLKADGSIICFSCVEAFCCLAVTKVYCTTHVLYLFTVNLMDVPWTIYIFTGRQIFHFIRVACVQISDIDGQDVIVMLHSCSIIYDEHGKRTP